MSSKNGQSRDKMIFMGALADQVVVITGASRGIGREIALMCAREGAKAVVLAAKTVDPHKILKGTINEVAKEVEKFGAEPFPFQLDVRDEKQIEEMMYKIDEKYGRIDILINNASTINLTDTSETTMKKFDLMQQVNARGTFACSKFALPLLQNSKKPQILNMSPPLDMQSPWIKDNLAYIISKFGMSFCTLGMSQEFKKYGIRVNSLWPKKVIATAAVAINFPQQVLQVSLKAMIMADAALEIFTNPKIVPATGQFWIDHDVLELSEKNYDFSQYEYGNEGAEPKEFLQDDVAKKIPKKPVDHNFPQELDQFSSLKNLRSKS